MICPKCGADGPYEISTRNLFKCRECYHQYSKISSGFWRCTKLPVEKRQVFESLVGTTSARQISIAMNVDYKTAWALCKKWEEHKLAQAHPPQGDSKR